MSLPASGRDRTYNKTGIQCELHMKGEVTRVHGAGKLGRDGQEVSWEEASRGCILAKAVMCRRTFLGERKVNWRSGAMTGDVAARPGMVWEQMVHPGLQESPLSMYTRPDDVAGR